MTIIEKAGPPIHEGASREKEKRDVRGVIEHVLHDMLVSLAGGKFHGVVLVDADNGFVTVIGENGASCFIDYLIAFVSS